MPLSIPPRPTGVPLTTDPGPDYMALPTEMRVFSAPELPDDPARRRRCREWLRRIGATLDACAAGKAVTPIDLAEATEEDRIILDEILLEGEVKALVLGEPEWQIEETAYTGLWRVRARDQRTGLLLDRLEVAPIPPIVADRAREAGARIGLPAQEAIPEGVINAPHVFAELAARSAAFVESGAAHVVNLGLLPLSDEDLTWLAQSLGEGPSIILSGGYGSCRIRSTRLAGTWWVQYYNATDTLILNTLEVAVVPAVACAAADDIADSAARIRAMEDAYP